MTDWRRVEVAGIKTKNSALETPTTVVCNITFRRLTDTKILISVSLRQDNMKPQYGAKLKLDDE